MTSIVRHMLCSCAAILSVSVQAQEKAARFVTQGPARTIVDNLYRCPVSVRNHRVSAVGEIQASDGTKIIVPAETAFQREGSSKGIDLWNECHGVTPEKGSPRSLDDVPIVEVDAGGEVITGYIVADNYFELYVNNKLVAVDAIPFTPFNSAVVRFKAKRPITYAFKLVDWEERLGLGMESGATPWHPGDGGLKARFSDGTVTDSSWRAQSFYIAPLDKPEDVIERGNVHDTSALGRIHPQAKKPECQERCYAVHYKMPPNWASPAFRDDGWPQAQQFTDQEVGATNLAAYVRFPEAFADAHWLWSLNLVFDNVVLARKTVR